MWLWLLRPKGSDRRTARVKAAVVRLGVATIVVVKAGRLASVEAMLRVWLGGGIDKG